MPINKLIQPSEGPIMAFNEIIRSSVGADLSRPAPIYRPLVDFPLSRFIC